jgi:hypothetical protein
VTDADLRSLVRDTMQVWGEAGRAAWEGETLHVTASDGRTAQVRRGGPSRWLLQAPERRPRPCTSIVALLDALRLALGPVESRPRLRVVTPTDA